MGTTDNTAVQAATESLQNKSSAKSNAKSAASSGLSGSVGMGARNAPDDVMKVSSALAANGLMEAPQSHADNTLFKGIIGAQEQMDSSLKRDGLVNPGGPTEQTFSRLADQGFVKPAPSDQQAPAAQPATGDAVLNADIRAGNKQNAVAAAEARVKANLSDDNRSDFRKAQDRDRLEKARDEAERAQGRARHEEAEQRRRNLERQAAAQQKANAAAQKQALEARKAVNAGLTKIVGQAGKMLNEALNASSRHSGPGSAPGTGSGRSPVSPDALDPGFRRSDGAVADGKTITLSDTAIAANRRTADALKRRTTVGDLPRFTVDAINTDGTKAVHEVADLIGQVHASDPEQAQELFARTVQGIGAEDRTRLEDLLRGGAIFEFPPDRLPGQPMDEMRPPVRTMELRPEDRANPDTGISDLLYRPGQDKPQIMPVSAKSDDGGSGAHPAEAVGAGKSSEPRVKPEIRMSLDERVEDVFGLDPDIERPKGLLPMPGKIEENGKGLDNVEWSSWTAPEWVHEGARAVALPKHVLDGGDWSSEDATKAAMTMAGGGAAASTPSDALRSGVTRLRGTPKFMRKVDLEEQGKAAARKVMDSRSSVPQAMFREDVGEITFDYGDAEAGFAHIRKRRMENDGMTEQEATEFITERIPEVIAHGKFTLAKGPHNRRKAAIVHNGNRVLLRLDRNGDRETWVLTGFEEWSK